MGRKMPVTKCEGCGRTTNSATSNYWSCTEIDNETAKEFGVATQCYVSFVMGLWVKGCVYDDICSMERSIVDVLLVNKSI